MKHETPRTPRHNQDAGQGIAFVPVALPPLLIRRSAGLPGYPEGLVGCADGADQFFRNSAAQLRQRFITIVSTLPVTA